MRQRDTDPAFHDPAFHDPAFHLNAFISSTVVDLPAHRDAAKDAAWRCTLFPLAMEQDRAESTDAITYSLGLVDRAHVYVGIFGFRYGKLRGPEKLSITEMEYRRAKERGIPILIFLMDDDHPVIASQVETDPRRRSRLKRLKAELRANYVVSTFTSPEDLAGQIIQSLHKLEKEGRLAHGAPDGQDPARMTAASLHTPTTSAIPTPPEPYLAHPYTLTHDFCGREDELRALDSWATTPGQPLFVIESIGGAGKSALTWEWVRERAPSLRPDLAGVVWWSFYESDATVSNFVRHTLAYVTGCDLNEVDAYSPAERERALLRALRTRPYLLVLDGLERILVAYHRLDAPYRSDEQVEQEAAAEGQYRGHQDGAKVGEDAPEGGQTGRMWHAHHHDGGRKTAYLRSCTDPRDGDLLRALLQAAPSKALISTRLVPEDLRDRGSGKLPSGVRHLALHGMAPDDAVRLWNRLGVFGDPAQLRAYLEQFDFHPLLAEVLAGRIARYYPAPGDFAQWHADEGRRLRLEELDLVQRRTHILEYALDGLAREPHVLLCRLAAFRFPVDYKALAALNPYLPPPLNADVLPPPPEGLPPTDVAALQGWVARLTRDTRRLTRSDFMSGSIDDWLGIGPIIPPSRKFEDERTWLRERRDQLRELLKNAPPPSAQDAPAPPLLSESPPPQTSTAGMEARDGEEGDEQSELLRRIEADAPLERERWDRELESILARLHAIGKEERTARVQALRAFEGTAEAAWAAAKQEHPEAVRRAQAPFHRALSELEQRGLLHWDRSANRYDLHPVVRAYAFEQLQGTERADTFKRIRDHFAALPQERAEDIHDLADLRGALEIYNALLGAGLLNEASRFYGARLNVALYRGLGACHTIVELLTPLFSNGLDSPPALSDAAQQSSRVVDLANAFAQFDETDQALSLIQLNLQLDARRGDLTSLTVALANRSGYTTERGRLATALRSAELASEVAEVGDNANLHAMAHRALMSVYRHMGRWAEAEAYYEAFQPYSTISGEEWRHADVEQQYARMCFYTGRDAATLQETLAQAADLVQKHRDVGTRRDILDLQAEIALGAGELEAAEQHMQEGMRLARRSGVDVGEYLADLARVRLAQGRHEEARALAAQAIEESPRHMPHLGLAQVYQGLGEREHACEHALAAYKKGWADGPPYVEWVTLQEARQVFAALGVPEPVLPPFDPSRAEPVPFEAEIRALIAEARAKRDERKRRPRVRPPLRGDADESSAQ